jgi:hypothetical protein
MLIVNAGSIGRALDAIAKRKAERDWLIVDTPGSNMNVLREAVRHADVVIGVIAGRSGWTARWCRGEGREPMPSLDYL